MIKDISPQSIAIAYSRKISNNVPDFKDRVNNIRYGLEWIISGIYQIILVLVISFFTNTVTEALACLLSGAIYRSFAGGVHFSKYLPCLLLGTFHVFLISIFVTTIEIQTEIVNLSILLTFIWGIIITILNSPKLIKKKKLFDQKKKLKNKILSVFVLVMIFIMGLCSGLASTVFLAAWLGTLFQIFTITSLGEWVISKIDNWRVLN